MSSTSPSVSVVVPTYNRSETLPRAIDSVLAQTHEDFELLVVDDGSEDGTEHVVTSYEDDRIVYREHETNRGANAARNTGIEASSGEYVSFLDSDDEYARNNLEAKVETLEDAAESFAGVFTPHRTYHQGRLRGVNRPSEEVVEFDDIVRQNVVGGFSCTAFRRSVFEDVGMLDEDLPAAQDYDFYLRTLEQYRMKQVDSTEVIRYLQSDSIGTSLERKATAHDRILEKHGEYLTATRTARQQFYLGVLHGRAGDAADARRDFHDAIRNDATLLRAYPTYLVSTLTPPLLPHLLRVAVSVNSLKNRLVELATSGTDHGR